MGLLVYILIYLFLIILILLAIIGCIPLVYSVEGAKEEQYFLAIRISWLGKMINLVANKEENKKIDIFLTLFGFFVPLQDRKKVQKRSKRKDIKKPERRKKKVKIEFNKYFSFFQRSFLDQSFRFIRRVLGHVLPKKYRLHLIYGFEDPADTGMLTGLIFMLFPNIPNNDMITINPAFDQELIQGEISIKGRIIVAVIIYYFLQFYFAHGIRQTIRKMRNK